MGFEPTTYGLKVRRSTKLSYEPVISQYIEEKYLKIGVEAGIMKIELIAWDSFSVRSMATLVKVGGHTIFIDPGIAIGPKRYGLGPSAEELEALEQGRAEILKKLESADVITISHYHYDHYFPDGEGYEGKRILAKDPESAINASQRLRAKRFLGVVGEVEMLDGNTFDDLGLFASPPAFHGEENSRLGWVVMVGIDDGKTRVVHASDVQGPGSDQAKEWIIQQDPDILLLSGYPTIFIGWRKSKEGFENAMKRLGEIVERTKVKKVVLDHHIARDLHYAELIAPLKEKAEDYGCWIGTAAEFMGRKNLFLEARRKELVSK